jgi:N-acetylglutamate synthase-like GNAT family acetyltransferase
MQNSEYLISTEKSALNVTLIHDFLSNHSYWAKDRSKKTVEKSIRNSLCFGVYDNNDKQVGFARVVTDYAVFAWILDVFILEEYRKSGLEKKLMQKIVCHPKLQNIKKWGLATDDAHDLYEKYGFKNLARPEIYMERIDDSF